jgi:hypothetical protein
MKNNTRIKISRRSVMQRRQPSSELQLLIAQIFCAQIGRLICC